MMVSDVGKRIPEADVVEDPMPMLMAVSRWCQEGRRDRCGDDATVDVAPMVSRISRELM